MKTAAKLTIAILVFCFSGIPLASANTTGHNYREAKLQKISTAKSSDGFVLKDTNAAIKPETKDEGWTVAHTKKPSTLGNKGFGLASCADPTYGGYARKPHITKVKLIKDETSSWESDKALSKAYVGSERKIAKMFKKNLDAVTTRVLKASILQPTFFEVKDIKDKVETFKAGKPVTEIAFTKKTDDKEKNPKPT